ncbi:MAG: 3D domain-containing protein [Akkermansiaceae bacterium]|nr:3D domain-containing protein [Akkermansiaceae bacterium]MDP4646644.1 3D domain-containing protein [Akkermansiaceae bacterium]MDP4721052.1 3D domain-containing protein [Akkermansiaceae bacterium]MDP4779560.1 3D domain-containing protein [Akkermansiaceae bacterium]MDP4846360.1 3D domain-containing protein [Akkermansiaceae bacterium]
MNRPKLLVLAAVLIAPIVTSCGPNLNILSKGDIEDHGHGIKYSKNQNFSPNSPSSSLLSKAASKPKDKHSMPIYTFGERNRVVRTTAYTCSEDDHLIYGSKNATGTNLRYSDRVRSAAADWSFYPVGTVFKVKGMSQLYVVDDYGSALTGTGTIDMYQPSKALMNQWGRRNVEITVVQWGSFTRSAELLAGRTKFSHCRQMLANIHRQRPDLVNVASR